MLAGATGGQVGLVGASRRWRIGILFVAFGRLIVANKELREARAELAAASPSPRSALRFARDLHDLLGHSLSVIALKARARRPRCCPTDPARGRRRSARSRASRATALAEVREAVSGYRRPTLAGELAGARMALEAAGHRRRRSTRAASRCRPRSRRCSPGPCARATTNVIRHSGARTAPIRILPGLAAASAEVVDDGRGARRPRDAGHGLPACASAPSGWAARSTPARARPAASACALSVPLGRAA